MSAFGYGTRCAIPNLLAADGNDGHDFLETRGQERFIGVIYFFNRHTTFFERKFFLRDVDCHFARDAVQYLVFRCNDSSILSQ